MLSVLSHALRHTGIPSHRMSSLPLLGAGFHGNPEDVTFGAPLDGARDCMASGRSICQTFCHWFPVLRRPPFQRTDVTPSPPCAPTALRTDHPPRSDSAVPDATYFSLPPLFLSKLLSSMGVVEAPNGALPDSTDRLRRGFTALRRALLLMMPE